MDYDLIVVGAGAMGLAAAYEATQAGKSVLVLEAGDVPGGMAAHQDLAGTSIERYYHFICKTDYDTFGLMQELGMRDKLRWVATKMGYFIDGTLHKWGDPFALLKFSGLNLIQKFRYGLMAMHATRRKSWDAVEPLTAPDWIKAWIREDAYQKLWHRLFALKFYQYTGDISATWIGTRIKRIGLSRESLFKEQLGYIDGGTETLVHALVDAIEGKGAQVLCSQPVTNIAQDDEYLAVTTPEARYTAAKVISTVPTPLVSKMIPDLPEDDKAKYDAIPNIGVACLLFKLKQAVTPNFWTNVIDDAHNIPGIIEFSNLRPTDGGHVVYVPYYMPTDQPRWEWSDEQLLDEAFTAIRAINPNITDTDIIASSVNRLRYSQPICTPNFLDQLPPVQTAFPGLQVADTSFYYPEDRGISESIKLGRNMARHAFEVPQTQYSNATAPADLS